MSVKVWRSHPPNDDGMWDDWEVECSTHPETSRVTSPDWMWAMEAAWGHIAMHHHRPPCTHEYGWHPASRPEEHQCLDCGTPLPASKETA